jgi:hypothetical protein
MKPRVADSFKVAGTPVYRGVPSVTRDAQRLLDGKIRYTEGQTYGQGIYVTEDMGYARSYGDLISMKLDDSAKMLRGEAEWDESFKFDYENPNGRTRSTTSSKFLDLNKIKMKNWAPADIRNLYLASKGYDGVQIYSEILLFNADKLTVNEEDIGEAVRKHQQHDQSSHGSWATGGEYASTDYQMSHRAPDPEENAPAYDLTGDGAIYPDDVYSADGARLYGGGEPEMARRVHSLITAMRGNPNAKVQIYRAVPKGIRQVNVGDWVTIDRQYAEQHGQSNLNNDYEILTNTVNADEIYTDGNSLFEWSYYPRVQKHQAGKHDQATHGSWAGANGYKLASKDDLPSLDSANYDSTVRNARDNYVGFGYTWMNAYLRDGYIEDTVKIIMSDEISKDEAIGQIESLKSSLYETQTTQDLTVTRWTRTGESIIGEKISETSDLESLIGKTYHAKGFTSTSAKPHQSINDGYRSQSKVLANIHMPAGTYGATVGNDRESEFILAPDTFFVVMGANDLGEGRISLDLLVTGQGNG